MRFHDAVNATAKVLRNVQTLSFLMVWVKVFYCSFIKVLDKFFPSENQTRMKSHATVWGADAV